MSTSAFEWQQSRTDAKQRCFSRTVRPAKKDNLTAIDTQVRTSKCRERTEHRNCTAQLDNGRLDGVHRSPTLTIAGDALQRTASVQ